MKNKNNTNSGIDYKVIKPIPLLESFIESIWMLSNTTNADHDVIVLPDGRFDIIFSFSPSESFDAMLMGLATMPDKNTMPTGSIMFAVSFKLLAIEYLLDIKAGFLLNNVQQLENNFWGITKNDLLDFDTFSEKITAKMTSLIKPNIDLRKQKLFQLIYESNGTMPVKELAENVFWSSRQINRYFTQQFGLSLKEYCQIIRFKASLSHIKLGKLFPELNFADQNHFIREIRKYSGVNPKELSKNQNDRFILFSAI